MEMPARRRRRQRQRRALLLSLVVWISPATAANSSISSASSSAAAAPVLGHDREWWLDRVLLSESFRFDGSHADFAQQFYRLFLDGGAAAQHERVVSAQLDKAHSDAVAARLQQAVASASTSGDALAARAAAFDDLSPLLQRAVLWDLGIVKAGDVGYTQVWTQCGLRMNELAVSKAAYEAAGCTAQSCSTPNGALYYQSLQCNGFQMGNATRCAAARGKTPIHAAMWSNGGEEWTLPDSFVAKHEWSDAGNNFVIYGIHLADDPNSYGKCVAPSMTVPCISYEQLSADDRAAWCVPAPSRLVTQWIRAESDIAAVKTVERTKPPAIEIVLSSVFAACVFLGGVWWIAKRQRERRRKLSGGNDSTQKNVHDATESEEDGGGVSYFFTDDHGTKKRRGMGHDPHATPVLGGCPTSFEKAPSFRREASVVGSSRRLREDNISFGQHPPQRDSTGLAHGDVVFGCGAVYAGSAYGDSSGRSSGCERKLSSVKGDMPVFPLESDPSGQTCASNSSTYISTNSDATADAFRWSVTRHDDMLTSSSEAYLSSSSSSASSARTATPKDHDTLSAISELLNDPLVMAKRVPYVDVSVSRQLSKGAFGEVWVGRMRDKLVAVKRLIPERRKHIKDLETFVAEIRLMAPFEHRNVMSLMGVAWNSPRNLCMMMEFLDNGDLQDLLKARSSKELTWCRGGTEGKTTAGDVDAAGKKTSIAIDVASGLRYLHGLTPQIVHRDLKSHNILMSLDLVAKLCDFGVSRANAGIDTMTCGVGTAYWTAPEVLVGDKYTETADVYSFGVVLTELDTHQLPFHDAVDNDSGERLEAIRVMHLVCMGELSPSLSPGCPNLIRELARDCMLQDPSSRPTLDEIIRRLRKFAREDGSKDDLFLSGRATVVSLGASSSNDPSSRRRTRLSSSFSIQDHDDERPASTLGHLNEQHRTSDDDLDFDESPRDSLDSDSGAVWI